MLTKAKDMQYFLFSIAILIVSSYSRWAFDKWILTYLQINSFFITLFFNTIGTYLFVTIFFLFALEVSNPLWHLFFTVCSYACFTKLEFISFSIFKLSIIENEYILLMDLIANGIFFIFFSFIGYKSAVHILKKFPEIIRVVGSKI